MAEDVFDPEAPDPSDPDVMEARLRKLAPRLVSLLADLVEGRKYIAIETRPHPDNKPGTLTTFEIIDNADAPPPAAPAEAV